METKDLEIAREEGSTFSSVIFTDYNVDKCSFLSNQHSGDRNDGPLSVASTNSGLHPCYLGFPAEDGSLQAYGIFQETMIELGLL